MASLLNLGSRAMFANYAALQTIGHNIANASTAGYSRQQVELATSGGQFSGAGFFGQGVDVRTVARSHDAFLQRQASLSRAEAARDTARLEQLQRLENVFPGGEAGLGYAAGQLFNAFVDVANRPQDAAAREVVLSRAEELANRFQAADQQIDSLQAGVLDDVRTSIGTVNNLAARVAQLNQQIAAARGTGQPPNDLLDQRDQLVREISEHVKITTIEADDGSLGLFIGGGQRLVLGGSALSLKAVPDAFDPQRVRIALAEQGGDRLLPADTLSGGRIGGLLDFQDEDLTQARALLGQLASAIAAAVNQQQSFGLDLRVPPGAGAPIFTTGAPSALPASTNARNGAGQFIGTVSLAVADAAQLQATDYELSPDASTPGNYLVTRRTDGLTRSVANGATLDGFTVTVGAPAPAAGDRFLLQPASQAAGGLRRVLDRAAGIAAASPVTATTAVANTGTASVASLNVVSNALDPALTANVAFTSNAGAYSWELRDAANTLVSSGTGTWTPGAPIALNGFELRLAGVPQTGDTLRVAPTPYPEGNNGNALSLLALRDLDVVGRVGTTPGATTASAYAQAMADIGVRVQSAKASQGISSAVATNAETARSGETGVNLDEEAARLLQFQQGYQAAAKILQSAQTVFDTLLSLAR
ncbi:MAG TPA: flagellar hook-associated protein FlgK [Methylibium sp.]|uniref:flagellar hook-associated protein FlgK n=1 Tax=Methylibium sp. TaxID=2067992 RepID=UPI002DB71886|nr:flagellar hook-associated protein FlgK [Methylibium sp.]HEU4457993.1 flagellar hook-associated protein FlgK [Methylibium sp.]